MDLVKKELVIFPFGLAFLVHGWLCAEPCGMGPWSVSMEMRGTTGRKERGTCALALPWGDTLAAYTCNELVSTGGRYLSMVSLRLLERGQG